MQVLFRSDVISPTEESRRTARDKRFYLLERKSVKSGEKVASPCGKPWTARQRLSRTERDRANRSVRVINAMLRQRLEHMNERSAGKGGLSSEHSGRILRWSFSSDHILSDRFFSYGADLFPNSFLHTSLFITNRVAPGRSALTPMRVSDPNRLSR